MNGETDQARRRRVDVQHAATLVFADGAEVAVIVTDVSQDGFKLTSEEILEVGEQVSLRDRHGDALAEIRWVRGFEAGGQFLTGTPQLK